MDAGNSVRSACADSRRRQDGVATIKPSEASELTGFRVNASGTLDTHNTTLLDLIRFGYSIHRSQVTGGPSWAETDKYDVTGKPNIEGLPGISQLRVMVQHLEAATVCTV